MDDEFWVHIADGNWVNGGVLAPDVIQPCPVEGGGFISLNSQRECNLHVVYH